MNLRHGHATKKTAIQWRAPLWIADAAIIRPATFLFLLSLLAGFAMVSVSTLLREHENFAKDQAQIMRDTALKHALEITVQNSQIRQYQTPFLALRGKGLIGDEQRLDWIAAIKRSQAQRQLLPISYTIEAQRPLRFDGTFDLGDYQLNASRMTLHMELLHEMDLLNLLDDLRRGGGFFAAQDCSIKRGGMTANGGPVTSLVGDCTLNWLTLGRPDPGAPARARAPAPDTMETP